MLGTHWLGHDLLLCSISEADGSDGLPPSFGGGAAKSGAPDRPAPPQAAGVLFDPIGVAAAKQASAPPDSNVVLSQ